MDFIKSHMDIVKMLGVLWAYHNGYLNFIPGFDAPKKAGPAPIPGK